LSARRPCLAAGRSGGRGRRGGAKRPFKFPIRLIKQGDGHEEFYDPVEGGNYQSRFGGVFNLLVKNADGAFTLTLKDQIQEQFSPSGKLTRISDRNGNALIFTLLPIVI